MNLTDEEKFLFQFSEAQVFGIYSLEEVYPLSDEFDNVEVACYWDGESSKNPDDVYQWFYDYHDEDEDLIRELEKYKQCEEDYEKWDFLRDLQDGDHEIDDLHFYNYDMRYKLSGIALTYADALKIKESFHESCEAYIENIYSNKTLKGYENLSKICAYLKSKAIEI